MCDSCELPDRQVLSFAWCPSCYGTFRKVLWISERICSQRKHILPEKNTADALPWQFFTFLGRAKLKTCGFSILLSPQHHLLERPLSEHCHCQALQTKLGEAW